MKRAIAILLITVLVLGCSAMAEDLGVQVIGGEAAAMETLTLDDMKLEQEYRIDGYARVTPVDFGFYNVFVQYGKDNAGNNTANASKAGDNKRVRANETYYQARYFDEIYWQESGENAEFAWFQMDITNMQKDPVSFMNEAVVKVVFDDEYEFAGWIRQFNYDYDTTRTTEKTEYGTFIRAAIHPDNEEMIDMVYTGHYVFGCTLPNVVVEGKEPLRMEITLGGNELTYHIRK